MIYVYGAGGHSQVVKDVLADMGLTVKAFINDYPDRQHHAVTSTIPGIRLTGEKNFARLDAPVVLAVGNNDERKLLSTLLDAEWGSAIHSTALIASTVVIGQGNVILHRSIVQANTSLGSHVLINTAASIDHDNVIEDYVHISPHATLSGHVSVGEGTQIGAGATVIPDITIGRWCTIGAGTVVINDIPDFSTAVGCPARIIKRRDQNH